ncbi:MAG: TetR/AcrR family transcriptional regulator [Roseomonas sp.]|nr:TetR/AcrR family transcriptional regulator [Roseomonas sp.]
MYGLLMQSHDPAAPRQEKTARNPQSEGRFHHGNLRQALIDAALAEPDIEGLSLRQLAAGLGVSAAAAYRHFENRDDLLTEVARIGFDHLQQRFAEAFPITATPTSDAEARTWLRRLALAYLAFADEEAALWRLMFGGQAAAYRAHATLNASQSSSRYLPAVLHGLFEVGAVARAPTEADALFVWSAIHGVAMLRAGKVTAALLPLPELAAAFAEYMVQALGGQPQTA